jgi:hypothetical protein
MPLCTFVQQSRGEINIKNLPRFSTENQQTEKLVECRVSSKQTKTISVRTETNRNKIWFSCVSDCFEPISKQPKQIELFRNEPKQTETTLNFLNFLAPSKQITSFLLFMLTRFLGFKERKPFKLT